MALNLNEPGVHIFVGFKGVSAEEELKAIIREFHPGGIVLFKRNIEGPEQLKELVLSAQALARKEMGRPLLVAIDQEGGTVQRLSPHFTSIPSAQSLAREGAEAVARWARICAKDLRQIGVQINFAPVLDIVSAGKGHFMESRSFGEEAGQVADLGTIWVETLQENAISATAKHFPGLGAAELDPHHFAPVIKQQGRDEFVRELIPFRAAMRSGVNCVMTSHAVYPAIDPSRPATLSQDICLHWLRERLGFGGILFSDDLDMAAISEHFGPGQIAAEGLSCGTDFFLLCQKSASIEPFCKNLSDLLGSDESLQQFHARSLARIEMLMAFHFRQEIG
jgi:beta-N-acetylhexosaminidase